MIQMRISFEERFWHRHAGIRFTRDFMTDPVARMEFLHTYNRVMPEKYREWGVRAAYVPQPVLPMVFGYGVATVPMILGCRVVFSEAQEPYAEPLRFSDREVWALEPPDWTDNPVVADLEQQAEILKRKYGKCAIHINYQSIPNIAFKLRGDQLFIDFYENPELVDHLFQYCRVALVSLRRHFDYVNRRNLLPSDDRMFTLDNCTVALLSPELYRRFLLPHDRILASCARDHFGIHHCGSNMHVFARDYGTLHNSRWYDIGYGSDVGACLEAYTHRHPGAAVHIRYGPANLLTVRPERLHEELTAFARFAPERICCASASADTPSENIRAFLDFQAPE